MTAVRRDLTGALLEIALYMGVVATLTVLAILLLCAGFGVVYTAAFLYRFVRSRKEAP